MPPHTSLQFTMPSNTATNTTSSNDSKPALSQSSVPKPLNRQRRATTSSSSYIFAPSWLINLNNKTGPASTVLSPAYASTNDSKKEDKKSAILGKRDTSTNKDTGSGFQRNRSPPHTKSRDYPKSRRVSMVVLGDNESATKAQHGRSQSSSQAAPPISSSPSSFDRNFPTLAKRKLSLSVDLPPKNVENIWANSDAKSKLLSPTALTPTEEDDLSYNRFIDQNQVEIERFKSLVPKVDTIKLDGKRGSKRKTSRSLSMDSVGGGAAASTTTPATPFRGNAGLSSSRIVSQTFRMQTKDNITTTSTRPIAIQQPTRPRAVSAASGSGVKNPSRMWGMSLSSTKLNGLSNGITGSGGKYSSIWSNPAKMGRVGIFKMYEEGLSNDRKDSGSMIMDYDQIEEVNEDEEEVEVMKVGPMQSFQAQKQRKTEEKENEEEKEEKTIKMRPIPSHPLATSSDSTTRKSIPISASLEREEDFLRQLGWKKSYEEDDDSLWAITDEERQAFVRLVRTLNGAEDNNMQSDLEDTLSVGEIDRAKSKWSSYMAKKQHDKSLRGAA